MRQQSKQRERFGKYIVENHRNLPRRPVGEKKAGGGRPVPPPPCCTSRILAGRSHHVAELPSTHCRNCNTYSSAPSSFVVWRLPCFSSRPTTGSSYSSAPVRSRLR